MSKQKKVIIFLVNSGDFSGAEKVNLTIIKYLQQEYQFYWASASGDIDEYLVENHIKHIIVDKIDAKTIRKIDKDYCPDLFHATDYNASVMCALAKMKTPYISHLHNNTPWLQTIHPYVFAYLLAAKRAKKILTVSDSIEKEYVFANLIQKKIQNISNPVCRDDILKYGKLGMEKKYDICFTGRFVEQKNPFLFLRLIKCLKSEYPKLTAVMVGDGELRADVEEKIKQENMSDYITLTGFQKNPYRYMGESKIFLLPSKYEGYGLVAFEALTLGLPCVVGAVGGLVDVVTPECGFLCTTEQEYLQGLKLLLSDTSVYKQYSQKAEDRAKQMENIDIYMQKIRENYEHIIL